jgi:hypothetical protein
LSGQFNTEQTVKACLYSTTGLCVKNWEFEAIPSEKQEFTLNLQGLQRGIYFLRLQIGGEVVTKKVVKL